MKIVDFDFVIDLALSMNRGSGKLYTVDNDTLAYRGKMMEELGEIEGPKTVREWARDYAESTKTGKEFRFQKVW
jgi:hypothetical protein